MSAERRYIRGGVLPRLFAALLVLSASGVKLTNPQPADAGNPPNPFCSPDGSLKWLVAPGDSVWQIAKSTGSRIESIAAVNHLKEPTIIHSGNVLTIPGVFCNSATGGELGPGQSMPATNAIAIGTSQEQVLAYLRSLVAGNSGEFSLQVKIYPNGPNKPPHIWSPRSIENVEPVHRNGVTSYIVGFDKGYSLGLDGFQIQRAAEVRTGPQKETGVSSYGEVLRRKVSFSFGRYTNEIATVVAVWENAASTTMNLLVEKDSRFDYVTVPVNRVLIENEPVSSFAARTAGQTENRRPVATLISPQNLYQLKNLYVHAQLSQGRAGEGIVAARITGVEKGRRLNIVYRNKEGNIAKWTVAADKTYLLERRSALIKDGAILLDERNLSEETLRIRKADPSSFSSLLKRADAVFQGEKTDDWDFLWKKYTPGASGAEEVENIINDMTREFILNQLVGFKK